MISPRPVPSVVDSYRIRLEGIRFRGRHGASRAERELPQDFVVDVSMDLPLVTLTASDSRARVFDYDILAKLVVEEGTRASYRLLETLAQRLIGRVLADTPALAVVVNVKKFGPPTTVSVDTAAIELRATRAAGS